jgi:hypothetical protein
MGKVNWVEAREMYIRDSRNSCSVIAKAFHVSKSTIQAKCTKENWPELRRRGIQTTIQPYLTKQETQFQEMNERHVEIYKAIEIMAANLLFDFSKRDDEFKMTNATTLGTIARICKMAITEQRKILGLPNGNPDDWIDINKAPEISVDEAIETLDKLIARQKRLEKLRNQQRAGIS